MDEDYLDEKKSAKFNAGLLSTERLNKILADINFFKMRPSAYNLDYHDYNFNLWFRNIDSLYDEIDGFIEDDEKKYCFKIRAEVIKIMTAYPVITTKKDLVNNSVNSMVDEDSMKKIEEVLRVYERKVREYGILHDVIASINDANLSGL